MPGTRKPGTVPGGRFIAPFFFPPSPAGAPKRGTLHHITGAGVSIIRG